MVLDCSFELPKSLVLTKLRWFLTGVAKDDDLPQTFAPSYLSNPLQAHSPSRPLRSASERLVVPTPHPQFHTHSSLNPNIQKVLKTELLLTFLGSCKKKLVVHCRNKQGIQGWQRIIPPPQRTVGHKLPAINQLQWSRAERRASRVMPDPAHPGHPGFELLPSGKREP